MRGNVYGISYRLKAFISFFSISLIIALTSLFVIPFISLPAHSFVSRMYNTCCSTNYLFYLTLILIIAAIILGAALIIAVFSKKIVFTKDALISKNAFTRRKLLFNEIKGFYITRFALYIETNTVGKKRISINLLSLNRADNLIQNLEKRFTNLDS